MRLCICASAGYILVINRPLGSIVKQQEPRPSGFALVPDACYLTIEPRLVYNYYIYIRVGSRGGGGGGGGGLSNMVYAHCKVKSVRGGALKQNFMDNNTRSVSLSLAVTPAFSGCLTPEELKTGVVLLVLGIALN